MVKPRYLYHGSGREFQEGMLIPKKPSSNELNNSLKGVYATQLRKWAMIMGILGSRGVKSSSTHVKGKRKIDAFVYSGWPKQNYFYVYTVSPRTFKENPKGSAQWISKKSVKPIKIEKFPMRKYIHWIKKKK